MDASNLPIVGVGGLSNTNAKDASMASQRLFWTLNGPLESAIQVAPNPWYEPGDVMEPYFRPAGAPGAVPSWHPVSLEPLTTPETSVLTVRVSCLEDWEELKEYAARFGRELFGEHPFGEHPFGEISEVYLLECCGAERPWAKDARLEVKTGGTFLTVHEYVLAVHPWLMAMRDRILDASAKLKGLRTPWPPETKLAVIQGPSGGPLLIDDAEIWAHWHRKPHVRSPGAPTSHVGDGKDEERMRLAKERVMARSAARIRELEAAKARAREMENLGVE